jgi:hypothetical protein
VAPRERDDTERGSAAGVPTRDAGREPSIPREPAAPLKGCTRSAGLRNRLTGISVILDLGPVTEQRHQFERGVGENV